MYKFQNHLDLTILNKNNKNELNIFIFVVPTICAQDCSERYVLNHES